MKKIKFGSVLKRLILSRLHFQTIILPLLLFLLNFVLKIRYVSWPSLGIDEPFSVYYSQFEVTTIIKDLSLGNNPPLYEIFLHYWTSIFGISEFSVRFPSALFSSLSVIFIYRICYKFFHLKIAVVAALLFTLSNYQIYFAHEARVYPLFMLLTIISMYQYMKLITPGYSKRDGAIFIVVNILLLYSHFFSWFVLFIQAFVLLVTNRKETSELFRFFKYYGIIFLSYLPYTYIFIVRFLDSSAGTWVAPVEDL